MNNILLLNDLSYITYCIKQHDKKAFTYNRTYADYYKYAYQVLSTYYNNEYFYKNEFINKVFKKQLAQERACIFNEFRISSSIADLVCINGHSMGFEIKTELDNNNRLDGQLDEYMRLFNEVNVIVPESKVDEYRYLPSEVGIIVYCKDTRSFSIVKPAKIKLEVDAGLVMQILHTREYRNIVRSYYGKEVLIGTNDFNQYQICSRLIKEIPSEKLNFFLIKTLKQRRGKQPFFLSRYTQFNQALLAKQFDPVFQESVHSQLERKINLSNE